jgi:hypothetical protein
MDGHLERDITGLDVKDAYDKLVSSGTLAASSADG